MLFVETRSTGLLSPVRQTRPHSKQAAQEDEQNKGRMTTTKSTANQKNFCRVMERFQKRRLLQINAHRKYLSALRQHVGDVAWLGATWQTLRVNTVACLLGPARDATHRLPRSGMVTPHLTREAALAMGTEQRYRTGVRIPPKAKRIFSPTQFF